MAKKTQKVDTKTAKYSGDRNIQLENIGDVCTTHMKIFGANINLMRQIPNLNDGLKPGERRLLYAMYRLGIKAVGKTVKVSKITGETIGSWHPHGDSSVYETLVRLAQSWNNTEPLIFPQGNFGSQMGDTAAAQRYIEARISKYAWKCFFEEFNLKYVSTKMNYLDEEPEPEYFPARYPNVLINNSFGIGYGMSTGLPMYNLQEVLELTLKLMDDPDYPDTTLIPDSPTGAYIVDEGQFKTLSETGQGTYKMRGAIEIDEENHAILIKTLPFQVNGGAIIYNHDARKKEKEGDGKKKIYDLVSLIERNELPGVTDVFDESDENEIQIRLAYKPEVDPYIIREIIFAKTAIERSYTVNFKLIDDYQDYNYNVRTVLLDWLDFRRETIRIKYNHELVSSRERQHILDIILFILTGKNGEKTIESIRKAKNREEIVDMLMKTFGITSLQAKHIADMRMSTFSKEGIKKLQDEKKELDKQVKILDKLVRNPKKVDVVIAEELREGIELFGQPRRSKVVTVDNEEKVRDSDHFIVFTRNGMIKKLPDAAPGIGFLNEGDIPFYVSHVNNKEDLLLFDQTGKVVRLAVRDVMNHDIESAGDPLSKYVTVNGSISAVIPKPKIEVLDKLTEPVYFLMTTRNGLIKKTEARHFTSIKTELLAMLIKGKESDELIDVKLLLGDKDIVVYTNTGMGVRFPSQEIRETARMSVGVKAIDLGANEVVMGTDLINRDDKYLFCLTNKGTGKRSPLATFKASARATKPLRITSLAPNEEVVLIQSVVGTEAFKVFLTSSIEEVTMETTPELPRLSKGKKLIPVRKGETIVDIKKM